MNAEAMGRTSTGELIGPYATHEELDAELAAAEREGGAGPALKPCFGPCGKQIADTPGNAYCSACIAGQIERAEAEQDAHKAMHGFRDPMVQAEIEGRV